MKFKLTFLATIFGLVIAFGANAEVIFHEPGDFSPSGIDVMYDAQQRIYKMWYYAVDPNISKHDIIYYRTSYDKINWSTRIEVLNPLEMGAMIGGTVFAVGDPSVIKESQWGIWTYIMYLTVCRDVCNFSDNEIWSVISTDGVNWILPEPLLKKTTAGNYNKGASEPSVIVDSSVSGVHYKVYYTEQGLAADLTKIKLAYAGPDRRLIRQAGGQVSKIVYSNHLNKMVSSANLEWINNRWYLFFNMWDADANNLRIDLYRIYSSNNESFNTRAQSAIVTHPRSPNPPPYCACTGSGALDLPGPSYEVFYAKYKPVNGLCNDTILISGDEVHRDVKYYY